MNFSKVKAILDLGVIGAAVALMITSGGPQPTLAESLGAAWWSDQSLAVDLAENETLAGHYATGNLLQGSNHFIYYITESGARQPIYDHDTLIAFGFQPEAVFKVDDEMLAELPLTEGLTRLVVDDQNNLYWVANGQRWQVNAWQRVLTEITYQGLPVSRLDASLAEMLPIRWGLPQGALLREAETVYYFLDGTIIPLAAGGYDEATVIDVPPGILDLYPQQAHLEMAQTRLNAQTYAANVRRGPGLEFEIIGTIYNTDTIIVTGRAENSRWLQINYQGQTGWLAGDLIEDQTLWLILPPVNLDQVTTAPPVTPSPAPTQPANTPVTSANPLLINCPAQPIRGFGTVWQNHPEVRPWLGCPFTNWRRDEHATRAAVQTFEHGWMLWLETDTVANVDPIYVFYEDDGSYLRFGDRPLTDAHKYAPTPAGFHKVGDRFAKIYWEEIGPQGRQRLGRAINEARDSLGAFQEFERGRMFWAGQADTIYVIYQGYFDFDGDGQTTWERAWTSYEDRFEDSTK